MRYIDIDVCGRAHMMLIPGKEKLLYFGEDLGLERQVADHTNASK